MNDQYFGERLLAWKKIFDFHKLTMDKKSSASAQRDAMKNVKRHAERLAKALLELDVHGQRQLTHVDIFPSEELRVHLKMNGLVQYEPSMDQYDFDFRSCFALIETPKK